MTDPPATQPDPIELLQQLGMSQYEAASYVALLRLGEGTARETSEMSDVPRTRVYDAIERLQGRGLVDVQHASPKVFRPVARETTLHHFRHEYDATLAKLADRLAALEPANYQPEQRGVWTITGSAAVDDRVGEYLTAATDEIVYLTVDAVLTDDILAQLREATERGVAVQVANGTTTTYERIQTTVPDAELVEPPWEWDRPPTGRLFLSDQETVLMSTLPAGEGSDETAILGNGAENSLVVALSSIVAWGLESADRGSPPAE